MSANISRTGVVTDGYFAEQDDNVRFGKAVNHNIIVNGYIPKTNNDYGTPWKQSPIVESGTRVTFTICVTPAEGATDYHVYSSGGYRQLVKLSVNGTEKQILSGSATVTYFDGRTPNDGYDIFTIYRFPNDGTVTTPTTYHWFKAELGNISTPMNTDYDSEKDGYVVANNFTEK